MLSVCFIIKILLSIQQVFFYREKHSVKCAKNFWALKNLTCSFRWQANATCDNTILPYGYKLTSTTNDNFGGITCRIIQARFHVKRGIDIAPGRQGIERYTRNYASYINNIEDRSKFARHKCIKYTRTRLYERMYSRILDYVLCYHTYKIYNFLSFVRV